MPTARAAPFKAEVLKMLANGQTATYIANALGISENIIYRWKSTNRNGGPAVGKKVQIQHGDLALENPGGEPQQLRDRVRHLETDREILKKALSIFSPGGEPRAI